MRPSLPPSPVASPVTRAHQAGFSLLEMLIATTITVFLLIGILNVFEANGRVAQVQTDLSEMQQAQRVAQFDMVRLARMAGRGGLPQGPLPTGLAISVRNNVGTTANISPGVGTTPQVLDATDVLTVRGVLTGPVYQIAYGNPATFVVDGTGTAGTIQVSDKTSTSITQDLAPLIDAVTAGRPEALIMVSPLSDVVYTVLELDPGNSNVNDPANITLGFFVSGGTYSAEFTALSAGGAWDPNIQNTGVAYMGLLEEYRYFVREVRVGADLFPSLSRARVYPNTEAPWGGQAASWAEVIAPQVYDLQVAIGVDDPVNGLVGVLEDGLAAGTTNTDEWLYNDAADNDAAVGWSSGDFYALRLTTLVRSSGADPRYQGPILQSIEDRSYSGSFLNTDDERKHRRRSLVTVVDLRNLS